MIHETACINKGARIGKNVSIGAYSVIGPKVIIGDNCKLHSHVVLEGNTTLGENNEVFSFTAIGKAPQDISYKGEDTKVVIGDNNILREYISIHRGTLKQDGITKIGSNNLLMAYNHFGHDVIIGNNVRTVNGCQVAGHVEIQDRVIMSGGTYISQFVRIGEGSFIGGGSIIDRDIPCFTTAYGNRVKLKGINIIGLKRSGVDKAIVSEVVEFFRVMEASSLAPRAFVLDPENLKGYEDNVIVGQMADFIGKSNIGVPPFMS